MFVNGRLNSDRSNYDQCSTVQGWFEVAGERVDVAGWTGVRDHSWGIGNHTGGPRSASIAPPPDAPAPPGLRQWCVFRLPDRAVFWQFHHDGVAAGPSKFESQCMFPYGDGRAPFAYTAVDHDVTWATDGDGRAVPRLAQGDVRLTRPDGGVERYRIEPISYPSICRAAATSPASTTGWAGVCTAATSSPSTRCGRSIASSASTNRRGSGSTVTTTPSRGAGARTSTIPPTPGPATSSASSSVRIRR